MDDIKIKFDISKQYTNPYLIEEINKKSNKRK